MREQGEMALRVWSVECRNGDEVGRGRVMMMMMMKHAEAKTGERMKHTNRLCKGTPPLPSPSSLPLRSSPPRRPNSGNQIPRSINNLHRPPHNAALIFLNKVIS